MDAAQQDGYGDSGRLSRMTLSRRGLLGDLLIREGLIAEAQLQEALRTQAELEPRTPLGQILVNQGAITQTQLSHVLDRYHKKYRLGDLLVETETITEDQLQIALEHKKETGLRLGEVLLQLNLVTEEEINQALCTQFDIASMDLDKLTIDRDLANLISRSYAEQHRVIPIAKSEDNILLAMDDPSDLGVVADLQASTGYGITVVTSTYAAFRRAFTRAYGQSPESGLARQYEELREAHEQNRQALTELRAAHDEMRRECEANRLELRELRNQHEATTQVLAQLQAGYAALLREHEATTRVLRDLRERNEAPGQDRLDAADRLQAVLLRLKS